MEVIAFVGPSGTGKSHRAISVAHNTKADLIIDDGLLIQGSRIIQGTSAKKQATKIGAVKTALFTEEEHRTQAQSAIVQINPQRILVLGTSLEMVNRIAMRLDLPKPSQVINIDEQASKDEMRKAYYYRHHLGKHVIPAPTLEVKRNLPNTLIDSLQVVLQGRDPLKQLVFEQSVIRPTFSYLGKFTIAENVLISLTKWVLANSAGVSHAGKVRAISEQGNTVLTVQITANYGSKLQKLAREIQAKIKETIENHTGLSVTAVNILITNLAVEKKERVE